MCLGVMIKSHSFASCFVCTLLESQLFSPNQFLIIQLYTTTCTDITVKHWDECKPLCRSARRSPLWPNGRAEPSHNRKSGGLEPSRQYGIDLDAKLLVTTMRGHAMPKDIKAVAWEACNLVKLPSHSRQPCRSMFRANFRTTRTLDMVKAIPGLFRKPRVPLLITLHQLRKCGIRIETDELTRPSRDG